MLRRQCGVSLVRELAVHCSSHNNDLVRFHFHSLSAQILRYLNTDVHNLGHICHGRYQHGWSCTLKKWVDHFWLVVLLFLSKTQLNSDTIWRSDWFLTLKTGWLEEHSARRCGQRKPACNFHPFRTVSCVFTFGKMLQQLICRDVMVSSILQCCDLLHPWQHDSLPDCLCTSCHIWCSLIKSYTSLGPSCFSLTLLVTYSLWDY